MKAGDHLKAFHCGNKIIIINNPVLGDELFTDSYEVKLVDDVLYEVIGKHVSRTEGDVVLAGSNASAEGADADEGTDSSTVSGIDFVLDNRLTETGTHDKRDY